MGLFRHHLRSAGVAVLAVGCGPLVDYVPDGTSGDASTGPGTTTSADATNSATTPTTTGQRPGSTSDATTSGPDATTGTEGGCVGCPVPAFAYQIEAFRSGLGGVALAADGGVFVGGWFDGNLTIQGEDYDVPGTDLLLFRLSPEGEVEWHLTVFELNPQRVESVTADGQERVTVAGTYQGSPDLGGGDLGPAGSDRIFLAQYDFDGEFRWARAVGSPFGEVVGVAALADGSLILAGNADLLPQDTGTVFGKGGGFVTRCAANGAPVWTRYIGLPLAAFDAMGDNVVVLGHDGSDNAIVRIDPTGSIVWEADAVGANAAGWQLAVASDGSVQALGEQSWLRYDVDGATAGSAALPLNVYAAAIDITANAEVVVAGALGGAAQYGGVVLGDDSTDAFLFTAAAYAEPYWAAELIGGGFVEEFRLAAVAGQRVALAVESSEAISAPGHPTPDFGVNHRATVVAYDL